MAVFFSYLRGQAKAIDNKTYKEISHMDLSNSKYAKYGIEFYIVASAKGTICNH